MLYFASPLVRKFRLLSSVVAAMKKNLLLFSSLILMAGCATMQQGGISQAPSAPTDYIIEAPFDQVWTALMKRATDRSWPIKTIDKGSGVLGTDFTTIGRAGLMGATGVSDNPFWIVEDGRQTVSVFVLKLDEKRTRIKPTMHYEAWVNSMGGRQWTSVASKGLNETEIATDIAHDLNAQIQPYASVGSSATARSPNTNPR
jgi:hypothetical protein